MLQTGTDHVSGARLVDGAYRIQTWLNMVKHDTV
jgi:hypothetical protein